MVEDHDYARLFRDAPVGIYRSTRDGRITQANPALARLLGCASVDQVLGLSLAEDVYAEVAEREDLIGGLGDDAFSGGIARWRRTDGTTIRVRMSGRAVRGADGTIMAFEGFVEDVTQQWEAEAALERVLASSGAILFRLAALPDGSFPPRWVSRSAKELLGYGMDEMLDPEWWPSGLHPDDRQRAFESSSRILTVGHVVHEYRFRTKDGEHRWFRDEGHLLRDAAGEPFEVVGVWTDITDQKERELDLVRSEQRLRSLTDAAPDGIVAVAPDGRISYVNAAAERLFGYAPGELVGRLFAQLFPERFRDVNERAFGAMVHGDEPALLPATDLLGRRADGSEFPGEVSFAARPEREGVAVTAIVRDMTERVELEVERGLLRGGHRTLLDEVDKVRSIISICAHCKNIEDDDGSWQQVEAYVRERTPIEFSHGLCPTCMTELYGSFAQP